MIQIIKERYILGPNPRTGGMADVYQATDHQQDMRRVAVKLFKHGNIEKDIIAESFRRETQALQELKHPGIVEMLDSGLDENTGNHFLVLEWMEKDLTAWLEASPLNGWDDFWHRVARPLLEALAFSHDRTIVHRDIKPSNILLDKDGHIKLADFGISKLKGYLQPTITLRDFGSHPFTPPELDEGSHTYTRDVYSFGVLVLKCLTNVELVNSHSIEAAVQALQAPPQIVEIIQRAVSSDPAERPNNAEVLLYQLEAVQKTTTIGVRKKGSCFLKAKRQCLERLERDLDKSETQIQNLILEDLNNESGWGISTDKKKDRRNDDSDDYYYIYGGDYRYYVKVDDRDRDHLVLINAWQTSYAQLQRRRDAACILYYEFKFGQPSLRREAGRLIDAIQDAVREHEENLEDQKYEAEKRRLFQVWGNILDAKKDWEQNQGQLIRYKQYNIDGNRVIFQLEATPENDCVGQPRQVINAKGRRIISGEVEEVKGDELILYLRNGEPEGLPREGELRFDNAAAEVALSRQKNALDAIVYNRAVRSDMGELLVNPEVARIPQAVTEVEFFQSLNPSQQQVVKAALGTEDFLLVQGPPGTGKTTFITEIIRQTIKQKPEARILLSSQTHVALDNALERIAAGNPDLKLVRIGKSERVSENVSELLLEAQMERWREEVIAKSKSFINRWSEQQGISREQITEASLFQELSAVVKDLENIRSEIDIWKQDLAEMLGNSYDPDQPDASNIPKDKVEEVSAIEAEISDRQLLAKKIRQRHKEIAAELEKLSKTEAKEILKLSSAEIAEFLTVLIDPNSDEGKKLQRLLKIQGEWLEQFGRNDKFNASLLKHSAVVAGTCIGIPRNIQDLEFDLCIVDEASKATATEMLVPMVRSHRWILVGDPKQLPPFQDEASRDAEFLEKYDLNQDDVRETLFDRLLHTLPEDCCQMLTIQHRMVKPIGNLISQCFYDGKLESAREDIDANLSTVLHPVTWLTTAKLPNRYEQSANSSFNNSSEVKVIVKLLEQLNDMAVKAQKQYSIAVLSGYAAQLRLLDRQLAGDRNKWQALTIDCNTVDAVQGKEADIVIYSVTRANKEGKIGFLRDEARLNVALSRGKVGLVIVGDHYFCRNLPGGNPLRILLEYIERSPKDCNLTDEAEFLQKVL
ncbi:MAG: hypothetical protein Fur0025_15040 [Oscillatoriaceae cyanobacterium]